MKETDRECIFWKNKYGQGIVLRGNLADIVQKACDTEGITPEEFFKKAMEEYMKEYSHE